MLMQDLEVDMTEGEELMAGDDMLVIGGYVILYILSDSLGDPPKSCLWV